MLSKKLLLSFLLSFSYLVSYGGIIFVTNGGDSGAGTLRNAVNAAVANDTIIINYKGGFALNTPIQINSKSDLTIIGSYAKHMYFTGDPGTLSSLFEVNNSTNIVFEAMGFWNNITGFPNDVPRAIDISTSSSVLIISSLFERCRPATGEGGAIRVQGSSSLRVVQSSFVDNQSTTNGGAISFDDSSISGNIQSNSFIRNEAVDSGGAVFIREVLNQSSFTLNNNTFYENEAFNTTVDNPGHAVYINYPGTMNSVDFSTWVFFRNNLLYLNGFQDQVQVSLPFPNFSSSSNFNAQVSNNYYYAFNSANLNTIPIRFRNNVNGADYWGFQLPAPTHDLGLRSSFVTDGYGLKYFTINDANSYLIDRGIVPTGQGAIVTTEDCRRAPRQIDGTGGFGSSPDIGAVEYTPYRVTGTPGANTWRFLVNDINSSSTTNAVHYVEFDLTGTSTEVPVQVNTSLIERTVYIDGFSQDGSAIPGPSNVGSLSSDSLTPARDLVTFVPHSSNPQNGFFFNSAPNSVLAGVSVVDFVNYGAIVSGTSDGTVLFGNTFGVRSNVASNLPVSPGDGSRAGGVLVIADDVTIGGLFHHQRNVLTDNGFLEPTDSPPPGYFGANLHLGSGADNATVLGNVIGLHPNGKETMVINTAREAHGIHVGGPDNLTIGVNRLFGLNVIGGHVGNGINDFNSGVGTVIDNNHIGVNFSGNGLAPNKNGIYIDSAQTDYLIGGDAGNVISSNDSSGIYIDDSQNIKIVGNVIGADRSVTSNLFGNKYGVTITGNSSSSVSPIQIGGDSYTITSERNTIVNNDIGIHLTGPGVEGVIVQGNLIGVPNFIGSGALPNIDGIKIDDGAHENVIGYDPGSGLFNQRNIIAGNTNAGIWLNHLGGSSVVDNNRINSNIIGATVPLSPGAPLVAVGNKYGVLVTDVPSTTVNWIGNENDTDQKLVIVGNEVGVEVKQSSKLFVFNATIGVDENDFEIPNIAGVSLSNVDSVTVGGSAEKLNVISGNDSTAVSIDSSQNVLLTGNNIGTTATGEAGRPNYIGVQIKMSKNNIIGGSERNLISGNHYGLVMSDSAKGNEITNNYFGLAQDGVSKIAGSYFGIDGQNLVEKNDFGLANLGSTNYFATDSVDINIVDSKLQSFVNNVLGYGIDETTILGAAKTGIGIRLANSAKIAIGASGALGRNAIANRTAGLVLNSVDSTQIQNTFFGTVPSGTSVNSANNQRFGIINRAGQSNHNVIGPNNVFGGNNVGISLGAASSENKFYKNYFGVDSTLASAGSNFENDTAVIFNFAKNNEFGFPGDSANQMANYGIGIVLINNADSNTFANNFIGITSSGLIGNNTIEGVVINNAFGNKFGSPSLSTKNTIAYNDGDGIQIVNGASGNSFLRNEMFLNGQRSIDINSDGVSPVGAPGIQDEIHTPIIEAVHSCGSATDIDLVIIANNLQAGQNYYIDIYNSNGFIDLPQNYGEARNSVYFNTFMATGTSDTVQFNVSGVPGIAVGDSLVGILTNVNTGSSSEVGRYAEILNAPAAPLVVTENELCAGALGGGSINVDNSANAAYDFFASIGGNLMPMIGVDEFEEDSLTSGSYVVDVDYITGCQQTVNVVLTAGNGFQLGTTTIADTCGLNTGVIELDVINNNITGFTFLDTTFSFDGGVTFQQNPMLVNQAGSTVLNTSINLVVTNGTITEVCPSLNNPAVTMPVVTLTTELDFTFNDFCSDGDGLVTTAPSFSSGFYTYSGPSIVLDSLTGTISGATDNDTLLLKYNYGTCSTLPAVQVIALATPDPSFIMADFCANDASSTPVNASTGGAFQLDLQPFGSETINTTTGELQTAASNFTTGNYQIIYQTQDPNCPRQDTTVVQVFNSPAPLSFSTAGNIFASDPIDVDSVSFCPTAGINTIVAASANANWIEPDGNTIVGTTYMADLSQDDSTYFLNYFYTVAQPTASPSSLQCQSTLDSLVIQVYKTPVRPDIINADVAYCESETVAVLEIGNSSATNAVNWFSGVTTNLVQANNNLYAVPTVFDNFKRTIFAQDSTGLGCYSAVDTAELIFFENPSNVALTYLSAPVANGDVIVPCPTSADSIKANSIASNTFWNSVASGTVNDSIFVPSNQYMPSTSHILEYFKDSLYSTGLLFGASTKMCESDRDTITVTMLKAPVKPNIVNGDTSYCFGEPILTLLNADSILTEEVLWYENVITDNNFNASPSNNHIISSNVLYNNTSSLIFARDSTGENCYSDYDTTEIILHTLPASPQLFFNVSNVAIASFDTVALCPSVNLLDSIRANTLNENTFWQLGQNGVADTSKFYGIVSAPLAFDTLSFYRDTLYTNSGKFCESARDTIFIDMLEMPVKPVLSDTAYCAYETIVPVGVISSSNNLVWVAHNETVQTTLPHNYTPTASSFNYTVDILQAYDSTGVTTLGNECLSQIDTANIAYHPIPSLGVADLFSTSLPAPTLIEICPTSADSLMSTTVMSPNSSVYWLTGSTLSTTANFGLNDFTDNSLVSVSHFRDTTVNLVVETTCLSDTTDFSIQTFNTPVQPLAGNTELAYCAGESIDSLSVPVGTNIIWTETGATDTTTANPHKYLPTIPATYAYQIDTITVQDFSGTTTAGIACVSITDTIRIAYHGMPAVASVNLQSDGLPVGDTVFICPTTVDSLMANAANNESFWYTTLGTNIAGNSYGLNDFADNTDNTVFYYRDTTVSLTVPLTCYSDTNSVVVRTYQTPITPSITSGGLAVDSVLYCTDNLVDNLGLLAPTDPVNWFQSGVLGSSLSNSNNYTVTAPTTFTGQTQIYVAYDSTGMNCFSANDSIFLLFHPRPDAPILTTTDNAYCEGDAIEDIFANDALNNAVISDWFLNDTTTTAITTSATQITPSYNFANDTTYTYYAQTESAIGCQSYFSQVGVSFHPTPVLPAIDYAGSGLEYCPEDLLDTISSDSTMTWFYQSNINITVVTDSFDLNDMPINPNTQDTIGYFYTNINNCFSDLGTVPVQVFAIPEIPVLSSADSTYCDGDLTIAPFNANNNVGGSLTGVGSWFDINGNLLSTGGMNSFSFGYTAPLAVGDTAIIFNYLNANGCLSENDTLAITTFPTPATPLIITTDSVYCVGEQIDNLNEANGANTNWYFVNNGNNNLLLANNSTFAPLDSGTYIAQTFENDCPSLTDSIEIVINQLPNAPIISAMPIEFCDNELIDTIRVQNGVLGYWYQSNDLTNPLATNADFFWTTNTITDSAQYFVNNYDPITDCFSGFDSITLYQFMALGNIVTEFAEVCEGFTLDLEAEGGITYLWNNSDTTATTTVAPTTDTWYFVDIIDSNNCFLQDSIEVRMKLPASCQEEIYTAFSPNGDGVNEVWEITGIEKYDEPIVYIFNRWGDQIAKIENYDNGLNVWDGVNQQTNTPVAYGTYYYIVEDGNKKVRDGWLQVVK